MIIDVYEDRDTMYANPVFIGPPQTTSMVRYAFDVAIFDSFRKEAERYAKDPVRARESYHEAEARLKSIKTKFESGVYPSHYRLLIKVLEDELVETDKKINRLRKATAIGEAA